MSLNLHITNGGQGAGKYFAYPYCSKEKEGLNIQIRYTDNIFLNKVVLMRY